ncbi:MAG TPA: type IV pilin, partial [Thermoplasmata archaeon]|nr:type IV pilin [Thermoplasmata archaeon]
MSDVIGTILLLALTVTLFGSVFYFVNTFPRPPPQPQGQFAASIVYSSSGALVADIEILHLAGPTLLDSQTTIYLQSLLHPGLLNGPATLASGLGGGTSWVIGQTWIYNVTSLGLTTPDNITVSVISVDQLLFRQTVPGNPLNIPPEFTQSGVTPATPTLLSTFNIYVGIVDSNLNPNSVWANFTELPGVVSTNHQQLTYVAASGTWQCVAAKCTIPASWANRTGIYYVFVNASDRSGLSSTIAIPVDIVSPVSGGGGLLSLALSLNQSAPVVGVPISVIALLTNNGAAGGLAQVNFTAGATNLGTATNPIGGGTSEAFTEPWTPLASNIGPIFLSATAKLPGVGTAYATLNLTVFPKILLVSHNLNTLSVANSNSNESALLANALEASGIPFTATTGPCT